MRLVKARWLRNGWLLVIHRGESHLSRRTVRPGESVTMAEAALALDTYRALLYRMKHAGRLKVVSGGRMPWCELIRLRRAWREGKPTTLTVA